MHLLDKKYATLSLEEQNSYLKALIEKLINSAALSEQAHDLMEVFDEYDFVAKEGVDAAEFKCLEDRGAQFEASEEELKAFMGMLAYRDQNPLYYFMAKGELIVKGEFNS